MSDFQEVNVVFYFVKDWEKAKEFYDRVLGWHVVWSDDDMGWREYSPDPSGAGTHIAINRVQAGEPAPGGTGAVAVLSVADVHKTAAALRAQGVQCTDPVVVPNVVTYATLKDPEGNSIQFVTSQAE